MSGGAWTTCYDFAYSGTTLSAECKTIAGNYQYTSINLESHIGNNDGSLVFGGVNYGETCYDLSLSGEYLEGECMNDAQDPLYTTLDLNDCIANENGVLEEK